MVVRRGAATGHLWQLDLPDDRCRLVDHTTGGGTAGTFGGQQAEVFVLEPTREGTKTEEPPSGTSPTFTKASRK